jgi:peroxiredoxin Q/BCP
MLEIGDEAPKFCLPDSTEQDICLESYRGKWLVLYFYPKDNTSGCTREAVDFTAAMPKLRDLGAEVVGVSRDSAASHRRFTEKHSLGVKLLSDPDHKVTESYGSWAKKKMYGKEGYGVVRSTFLIDPEGRIMHSWRKVQVKGHADDVIKVLREMKNKEISPSFAA